MAPGMAHRRATSRLRYRRLAAVGSALMVTLVAVLGGVGVLPETPSTQPVAQTGAVLGAEARTSVADDPPTRSGERPRAGNASDARFSREDDARSARADRALDVPARSGEGRRVVFDMGEQRVWLVKHSGDVRRTYLVSGSRSDNLDPGRYEVYSTSERAWGIDDSGTMRYMVRFAYGNRAAIGFHDIPVKDGRKVQTRDELGSPRSHGCIRQSRPDAKAMWDFAPVGTPVVVVA